MTLYYFWISYNKETNKYGISGNQCIENVIGNKKELYLLRDVDFSYVVKYNEKIKLYLVSYETNRAYIAYNEILKSFNEVRNNNVKVVKTIEFKIPENINYFENNDEMKYDMSEFDMNKSHSKIRVSNDIFSINLIYKKETDREKSYLYVTHPRIVIVI